MLVFTFPLFSFLSFSKTRCTASELAKAECVMEMDSHRILYESHGDTRLPMASTTKIVTAITVLSLCKNLQEEITVPESAAGIEGSSAYLKAGDKYSVEDLLYGLMLRSGNDCAVALAEHVAGSVENFAVEMNRTAERAGALNSRFSNPHGLPSKNHYTTARDLTGIACYSMQNERFREIVSTKYYEPRHWKNKNKLLYQLDGAIGVKTGYTKEAGRCLVSAAERENMTLVCTVLNCRPMYERSATLLNDAFAAYKKVVLLSNDEIFTVEEGKRKERAYVKTSFSYPLLQEEKEWIEYTVKPIDTDKKIKNKEEIIGQLEIYLSKRLLFSTNLYKL